jgi:uncharacterized membrane-anchored protein
LAVAYYAAFLWFQLTVGRRSSTLTPLLTVAGFVLRLSVFAAVLILLALFTGLNIIATGVAFAVVYTMLSGYTMYRYLATAKRDGSAAGEDTRAEATTGGSAGRGKPSARPVNGPKGA